MIVVSYLPEVLGLADRLLVMREGSVAGELSGGNLLNISSFYLQIIIGALILIAVAFDQFQGRRSRS